MEMILGNGFCEMSQENLMEVDGGLNWKKALAVFAGTVGLAWSLPVGVLNPGAGLVLAGSSCASLDYGIH